MRMDENINPEWGRMLKSSSHGRAALREIERLRAENGVLKHNAEGRGIVMSDYVALQKERDEGDRRAEIMWQWMVRRGHWLDENFEFLRDHPEAADWFDEEGKMK